MLNAADITFLSVGELGRLIRDGEVSPVELAQLSLERLDTIGRSLNAVATLTEEVALAEAAAAQAELRRGLDRGPLHGIPYGMKDIVATAGIATSWGVAALRSHVPRRDATIVRRLRDAGAVLTAKLATIELAGGMVYDGADASVTGPTSNPWDRRLWVGGSSSGSAAATAAGTVAFSIGSDTAGSIIVPAAWSGLAGLRPTYGRVSRAGAMTLAWTLDRLGPLCRSAGDCGLVLEAIAGPDRDDPSAAHRPYRYRRAHPRRRRFRFGAIAGAEEGWERDIARNYAVALEVLAQIGSVEQVELPAHAYEEVGETILAAEASAAFDEFIADGGLAGLVSPKGHVSRLAGTVLPAVDYLRAQRIRRHICRDVDDLASGFDALVAPSVRTFPPGTSEHRASRAPSSYPRPVNWAGVLAGSPTLALPTGFGANGLPTGLQLIGARFGENSILDAACAYEEAASLPDRRPPVSMARLGTEEGS